MKQTTTTSHSHSKNKNAHKLHQNEYTNNDDTQKDVQQIISALNSGVATNAGNSGAASVVDEYQVKTGDNSFQNALYPQGL